MASSPKARHGLVLAILTSALVLSLPVVGAMQGRGNNIPQQIADLDALVSQQGAAIAALQASLIAEASARAGADATLQNNIDAESAARQAADNTLQNTIVSEEVGVITYSGIVNPDGTTVAGNGFTVTRLGTGQYRIVFPAGTFDVAAGTGGLPHRIPVSSFMPIGDASMLNTSSVSGTSGSHTATVTFSADTHFHFIMSNSK